MTQEKLTWRPVYEPLAQARHDDIWLLSPKLGWAVGGGYILRMSDGNSWDRVYHDADLYFRCIGFASKERGWVGTISDPNRPLLETRDGGATWNPVADLPTPAPVAVCGLSVVNASVVYASGTNEPFPARKNYPPRMMRTKDGGASWTAWEMSAYASLLVDTYFTSPDRGWVVGGQVQAGVPIPDGERDGIEEEWRLRANVKPVVLFTEDGGQTWVDRVADIKDKFPLCEWGWKIQFINDELGFVSLENPETAAILKTKDGGEHWTRIEVKDPQGNNNLEGIGFVDEETGWVGGWGTRATDMNANQGYSSATCNAGETWMDANEIGTYINRFRFLGSPVTFGYASGKDLYQYSAEPIISRKEAVAPSRPRFLVSGEPAHSGIPVKVRVTVPSTAASLRINIWGRFGTRVRSVEETEPKVGSRTIEWDGKDDNGRVVGPGSYIIRVTIDDESESQIVHVSRAKQSR